MTLLDFFCILSYWNGKIILNDINFGFLTEGMFYDSINPIKDPDSNFQLTLDHFEPYLYYNFICFTPCHNPNALRSDSRVWLEVMIQKPLEQPDNISS